MVLPSPVGESVAANFISKPFLPRFPQRVRRAFCVNYPSELALSDTIKNRV
jgi:hypothetical protein